MATTKLTLSVDDKIVAWARELSKENHTSISNMFSRYIQALKQQDDAELKPGPLTREMLSIGKKLRTKLPADFDEKEFRAQAMADKYGIKL